MKKPFIHAFTAALYIVSLVLIINSTRFLPQKQSVVIPITMLGLLVLSVAVMGYLFLSEPFRLYMENRKQEAIAFFAKVVGIFACFVIVSAILILVL